MASEVLGPLLNRKRTIRYSWRPNSTPLALSKFAVSTIAGHQISNSAKLAVSACNRAETHPESALASKSNICIGSAHAATAAASTRWFNSSIQASGTNDRWLAIHTSHRRAKPAARATKTVRTMSRKSLSLSRLTERRWQPNEIMFSLGVEPADGCQAATKAATTSETLPSLSRPGRYARGASGLCSIVKGKWAEKQSLSHFDRTAAKSLS